MEKINDLSGYSIEQWEDAINRVPDIELEEVRLYRRKVVGASGFINMGTTKVSIKWLWDGRAFIGAKRMKRHDLKFEPCTYHK